MAVSDCSLEFSTIANMLVLNPEYVPDSPPENLQVGNDHDVDKVV